MILKQFVTSLETVFIKFYQDFIVVIQPPIHLVLEKLALLRKCIVSAKCIWYKIWEKNIDSFKRLDKPKLFFQKILYSCKENETFVSARKQLYENQRYKNSCRLVPDTHSADENLKQAVLQTFIWRQCM